MIDQNSRPARKVGIADHLWEAFEDMAQQMGSDRDALINQALFMFARLNGFLEVKSRSEAAVAPVAAAPVKPVQAAAPPRPAAPPVLAPAPRPESTPAPARPPVRATPEERASANGLDNDPVRREVAERVLETAAELERLIKGKNSEPPPPADDMVEEDEEPLPEAEDPGLMDEEPPPDEVEEEPADDLAEEEDVGALYLVTESGEQEQIVKERFVIGRGKHCDFVINSGKVSREHAVIVHEGDDWIIEDLGSSNGTWFNKQRIKRRKVEDGDEYFICSEKIRLLVR
ncbi:FHA domain-containing protein [Myxococcus xanthus]|uniref:FHA domain-containing protein n=1 Tax=Myxococcus xanthus TaxID=34 RepID=A0A7Y4IN86_MYXXA|nr:FHA domain-containing protein [Myxococcus xanthus]NOJ82381.1 FHA domain-containing protein [Myxococcus xanthus]NOJ89882.1 FHA domain-containing protein [Myxococcus xanthus]